MAVKTVHDGKVVSQKALVQTENFLNYKKAFDPGGLVRYSETLDTIICECVAQGMTLDQICEREDMPHTRTLQEWMHKFPEFYRRIKLARERRADQLVSEALIIADDTKDDIKTDEKGRVLIDWENVQRSKLRVDVRKWQASKLAPKKYGDKLEVSTDVDTAVSDSLNARLERMRAIITEYRDRGGDVGKLLTYIGLDSLEIKQ